MKFLVLFGLMAVAKAALPDTTTTALSLCNMNVCGLKTSIACYFTQKSDMWCNGQVLSLDPNMYVQYHNTYRQKIASGGYPKFPTAARMAEMKWSDELAQMALYNVKRCQFGHDDCRDTQTFKFSGQNLAISMKYGYTWDYTAEAKEMMDGWFNEQEICDTNLITKYYSTTAKVGHFTQMVKDSATHVGCAAVFYNDGKWDNMLLACNYARTNMIGEPTYVSGSPGSQCSQKSSAYNALCAVY